MKHSVRIFPNAPPTYLVVRNSIKHPSYPLNFTNYYILLSDYGEQEMRIGSHPSPSLNLVHVLPDSFGIELIDSQMKRSPSGREIAINR